VDASLDSHHMTLRLVFNSVRKLVPLKLVRNVSIGEVEERSLGRMWHVQLEIEGDRFCTFVFDATEQGAREASYFGGCLHLLTEAARFEAVKKDLTVNTGTVIPVPTDDGLSGGSLEYSREATATCVDPHCSAQGDGAAVLISKLLKVGGSIPPDEAVATRNPQEASYQESSSQGSAMQVQKPIGRDRYLVNNKETPVVEASSEQSCATM